MKSKLKQCARMLRKNQTDTEKLLWQSLRSSSLVSHKFRRQVELENYIVDFVCFDKKLIVELDGGQHNEDENAAKDEERDNYFVNKGYKVLRFWNNEVINNTDDVLEEIVRHLES